MADATVPPPTPCLAHRVYYITETEFLDSLLIIVYFHLSQIDLIIDDFLPFLLSNGAR